MMLQVVAHWTWHAPPMVHRARGVCRVQCHNSLVSVLEQNLRKRGAHTQVEHAVSELYVAAQGKVSRRFMVITAQCSRSDRFLIDVSTRSVIAENGQAFVTPRTCCKTRRETETRHPRSESPACDFCTRRRVGPLWNPDPESSSTRSAKSWKAQAGLSDA